MKKMYLTALAVLAVIGSTLFLIFVNDIAITIRLKELRTYLQEIDHREGSIDHIGLIATYEINKKMYEKSLSPEKADIIEQEINSLLINEKEYSSVSYEKYSIISEPAVWVINFNRMVLGKEPINSRVDRDYDLNYLDVAYYLERNFMFTRAIAHYEKALSRRNITDNLKASILLHQGYCYALSGMNDKARNNYQAIVKNYTQESSAVTATILLKYLEGFTIARQKILKSTASPLFQSQELVKLLAYGQALEMLDTLELNAKPEDIALIQYNKARCYAGLGKLEKAVETYVDIISSSPSSQYARYSNRKLFMIGSKVGGSNEILKISIQINKQLKDPVLSEMLKNMPADTDTVQVYNTISDVIIPEKIIKKAEKFISDTAKSAHAIRLVVIDTSDGNTFKGSIVEETKAYIALNTSIGRIEVKRNKISRISTRQ